MMQIPVRQIRARYDEDTIRVYQAYSHEIADPAIARQRFVPPFRMNRMSWIKPSFLWMMCRSGWGTKKGQERVLAIDISRCGFEWALKNSCLSHFIPDVHNSEHEREKQRDMTPVRIQWDPERDCDLERLDYRSIQIGLAGEALKLYVEKWTQSISDVTQDVERFRQMDSEPRRNAKAEIVSNECPYDVDANLAYLIGLSKQ